MFAMYLRKSRQDIELEQVEGGDTLSRHYTLLTDLAKKLNIVILDKDIYKEGVVSGETIQDRPVIQKLLSKVEKGVYEGVLVTEISRLSRGNSLDQAIISRTFNMTNTKIITLNKTFIPNNDIDEEYFEFDLFMSRREYKMINQRMQRGRLESLKEGKLCGRAPYGYEKLKIKNGKGYTLIIKEEEARVVRKIFDMYLEGKGLYAIATYLNNLGLKTGSGNLWNANTIYSTLTNYKYCGYVTFGRQKKVKTLENGIVKKNRKLVDDFHIYKGLHEPIVSKEIFDKVQELRSNKPKMKKDCAFINPLAGLVYCTNCGCKMVVANGVERRAICCRHQNCVTVSAKMEEVEEEVIRQLKNYLSSYQYILDNYAVEEKKSADKKIKELKALNNTLDKCNKMLVRACEMLEEGIYTKELYLTRRSDIELKIMSIKQQIQEVENKQLEDEVVKYKKLVPKLDKCINEYYNLSIKDRNRLLKGIIKDIQYTKLKKRSAFTLQINFKI